LAAAALIVLALVALIGSAQAAPSTKIYDATVYVADASTLTSTSAKLTLTLKNDSKSKQTLGSANFVAPDGMIPTVPQGNIATGWTATVDGNIVKFRSTSNALTPGSSVSAGVTFDPTASPTCTNATWKAFVKQSNDFSGNGNDFSRSDTVSNLRPLGSFTIDDVETVVPADPDDLHVPQILVFDPAHATETTETVRITAYDVCGGEYTNYGAGFGNDATLAAKPDVPARLAGVDLSTIAWGTTTGVGTVDMKPSVVETGDFLRVTDVVKSYTGTTVTSISADSNDFDVVQKLCTSEQNTDGCQWTGKQGKITVDAAKPPAGDPDNPPSLGIGFFDGTLGFSCAGGNAPVGGTVININPRGYSQLTDPRLTVTLTYDKSLTGNGPASAFTPCLLKDYGELWTPVLACTSSTPAATDANCFLDRKKVNGNLQIILSLKSNDPWGGIKPT